MLSVAVTHRLGDFTLDAAFESEGGLTALFGRSGAGKTSLVNAIAGLIRPERGRIVVDGAVLTDTATRPLRAGASPPRRLCVSGGAAVPAPQRAAEPALRALVRAKARATGPSAAASSTTSSACSASTICWRGARPICRAARSSASPSAGRLLARPRLLVMDEPLASLDERRRGEILPYIERLRDEMRVPIVYVSHSIPEVARLATTLVVLSEGKVAAIGPTAEVMGRIDLFPLTGRAEAGAILATIVAAHDRAFGLTVLRAAAGELRVPYVELPVGAAIRVRIRARDVMIALQPPVGLSALNVLPGTIAEIAAGEGPIVQMRLDCAGEALVVRLTRRSVETLGLEPGKRVHAVIKSIAFDHHAFAGASTGAAGADADMADG